MILCQVSRQLRSWAFVRCKSNVSTMRKAEIIIHEKSDEIVSLSKCVAIKYTHQMCSSAAKTLASDTIKYVGKIIEMPNSSSVKKQSPMIYIKWHDAGSNTKSLKYDGRTRNHRTCRNNKMTRERERKEKCWTKCPLRFGAVSKSQFNIHQMWQSGVSPLCNAVRNLFYTTIFFSISYAHSELCVSFVTSHLPRIRKRAHHSPFVCELEFILDCMFLPRILFTCVPMFILAFDVLSQQ